MLDNMKRLLLISFVYSLASACITPQTSKNRIAVQLDPDGFAPWDPLSSGTNVDAFNAAIHLPPFFYGRDYAIKPGYVKSWEWNASRKTYSLTIDENLKFHNGQAIRASDFEFALVKPFVSKLEHWERSDLLAIKGIRKLERGTPYRAGLVEGVRVIDDRTIEIALEHPDVAFLYKLSQAVPPLGPIDSFNEDLFTPKTLPIGCGRYKAVKFDEKAKMVEVERIAPTSDPAVPTVIDFFMDGSGADNKVDLAVHAGAGGMMQDPNYTTRFADVPLSVQVIGFNNSNKLARHLKYRQAIEMAIDKDAANQGYTFSRVTDQLVAPSFYGYIPEKPTYQLDEAKKLIQDLPAEFRKTKHRAFYHGPKTLPKYLTRIKDQLAKVGLDFEFEQSDQNTIQPKDTGFEMNVYGLGIYFTDPLDPFSDFLPNGINPFHALPDSREYARLYEAAQNAADIKARSAAISKLSEYCRTQVCFVPLAEDRQVFVYGSRIASIGAEQLIQTFDYDLVKVKNP